MKKVEADLAKVHNLPMFAGVDEKTISSLLKGAAAQLCQYRKRETVFPMLSAVQHVFVVISGALKISEYGEKGAAHILRICRPGHIVGLAHILGHLETFPGSCIAVEESEVLVMDIDSFHRMLATLRYLEFHDFSFSLEHSRRLPRAWGLNSRLRRSSCAVQSGPQSPSLRL